MFKLSCFMCLIKLLSLLTHSLAPVLSVAEVLLVEEGKEHSQKMRKKNKH